MFIETDSCFDMKLADMVMRTAPWKALFLSRSTRIALMTLQEGQEIPLHDHPCTDGFLFVLSGRISVQHGDLLRYYADRPAADLRLRPVRILRRFGFSRIKRTSPNIHGFKCLRGKCRILDILKHPRKGLERSWFFPFLQPNPDPEVLTANVVKQPYVK